jgi:hypothetical protein
MFNNLIYNYDIVVCIMFALNSGGAEPPPPPQNTGTLVMFMET